MKIIQGDVILKSIDAIPATAVLITTKTKVLQMSEVTGHHHHFRNDAPVTLYTDAASTDDTPRITPNLGKYIWVAEDTVLYHGKSFEDQPSVTRSGDHNSVTVPAGFYYVDIVREYDYDAMETRRVTD